MVTSNTEPQLIEPDFGTLKKGKLDILVHWDIVEQSAETPDGIPFTQWSYSEARIPWTLPEPFSTREAIQSYLDSIYDSGEPSTGQILQWAKASKVNHAI